MKRVIIYFLKIVYSNTKHFHQTFISVRSFVLNAIPSIIKILILLCKKLQEPRFQKIFASSIAILAVIFVAVIPDVIPDLVSP